MGTELSLCAALVPAALKLKFTLFVRKHTCSLPVMLETNVPALPCSVLTVRSCGSVLHTFKTLSIPHLFKNIVQIATFQYFGLIYILDIIFILSV